MVMTATEMSRHDGVRPGQAEPGPPADVHGRLQALYAQSRAVAQQIDLTYGRGLALRQESLTLIETASRARERNLAASGGRARCWNIHRTPG
jgi:hypothetical protein